MKELLKRCVVSLLPKGVRWEINRPYREELAYGTISYAQEGEDILLSRIFGKKTSGFYVDVGAHHPKRFSNTHLFYKRGWRGINIDPLPGTMAKFDELRPRDINLEIGISQKSAELQYYMFDEPALNGFSNELTKQREQTATSQLIETRPIQTYTLSEVLDQYLPPDQVIDFLTVDAEGLDYEVILSNDWTRYRPQVVLVEAKSQTLSSLLEYPLHNFLTQQGYKLSSKTLNTVIYYSA